MTRMATKQVTDWLRRFHYRVDPSARVIDCFRVEVMDMHLLACSFNRPNVTLKQLWAEALDTAKFLQNQFAQRDWRQFGLKGPNDLRPFAMIIGCEEAREKVNNQVNFDLMIGECHPYQDHRVRALVDAWDGLEWLAMN
jgi:hypothetical protein